MIGQIRRSALHGSIGKKFLVNSRCRHYVTISLKYSGLRFLLHQQNGKEQIDTQTTSANTFPGGFQAIATAYGDYTKKSFEDTKSFVEKLSGVKSFEKGD